MSTPEQRHRFADLLEKVASGLIPAEEAFLQMQEWTDIPWKESLIADAYHHLQHFHIDADVRARKRRYASMQQRALTESAERLRKA